MAEARAIDTELIRAIYDSVREPILLKETMERFAQTMQCDATYFKMIDQKAGDVVVGVGGGMPEGSDRDYLENYLHSDVRVPRVNRAPQRKILDDRQVITQTELRGSAFHNEFLPKYELTHLLHVNISPSLRFPTIVTCAQGRGEFLTRQSHTLGTYVPHFQRAGDLHLKLRQLGGPSVLVSAAFDILPTAGMILDADGNVIFANSLAKEILATNDGLAIRFGRLSATDSKVALLLERSLRQAIFQSLDTGIDQEATVVLIGRPSGRLAYRLEMRPLPVSSGFRREDPFAAVLVLIEDPDRNACRMETTLRQRYGLTPAETALAVAVASGTLLREYAEQRGVTIGTVRFQMKQILAKTDSRRQSDLVRLINMGTRFPRG